MDQKELAEQGFGGGLYAFGLIKYCPADIVEEKKRNGIGHGRMKVRKE